MAIDYRFLATRRDGPIESVTLNRPEVRNAFDEVLIAELTDWATRLAERAARDGVRVAVLAGAGPTFCAGADVAWMAKTVGFTAEENVQDAAAAARMFAALDAVPVPLIARIQGAAIGGGAGLAAVSDAAVADESAVFAFSEVKLGILPAVIAPFVLAKIGRSAARELFLTGCRFSAARAREIGLIHAVAPLADLDRAVAQYVDEILASGPEAIAAAKALIRAVWGRSPQEATALAVDAIAGRRVSAEGQEGLRAFLEKRKPSWRAHDHTPADRQSR
jgi:methylglutaconyl-CoA hydratase